MVKKQQQLVFSDISNSGIFGNDFANFCKNNVIDFSNESVAILYAPNGVGKTSLARVLDGAPDTHFDVTYSGSTYNSDNANAIFHVIADQNNRNIIHGETEDFILGDNIRNERKLKQNIDIEADRVANECRNILKRYGVTKKEAVIIEDYEQEEVCHAIKKVVKRGSSHEDDLSGIVDLNNNLSKIKSDKADPQDPRVQKYINNRNNNQSILAQFLGANFENTNKNKRVREIGENTDAIVLLNKYAQKDSCIVCDNHITPEALIKKKELNRQQIIEQLDEKNRSLVEQIMSISDTEDILGIKHTVERFFETGNPNVIQECKENVVKLGQQIARTAEQELIGLFKTTDLFEKISEYEEMLVNTPEISDEDVLYLTEVVSQSMGKNIKLTRDNNSKNLIITLDGQAVIEKPRASLPLSAGEQNFLSLAFEMLKAKNSKAQVIVLDDPISSFDSIYKYKIVYLILRAAQSKKMILLTHNVDLIRLVHSQKGNCFQMYILNNGENEENGFIEIRGTEVDLIIDLSKMADFFRMATPATIKSVKEYLVATIPFMRSFAKIMGNKLVYDQLMPLMHGRENSKVDIAKCYNELFHKSEGDEEKFEVGRYILSAQDIMSIQLPQDLKIINTLEYPLLNKALNNTIGYLKMRLMVEKNLINQFNIPLGQETTNSIIRVAYPGNDNYSLKNRTKLMSKKTLLNEFNHFEGNLSIFQPAIDISDRMLKKEQKEIEEFFAGEDWKKR